MTIHYVIGDATDPCLRPAMIFHACNDQRKWGSGFVMALSAKWKQPELTYRLDMEMALGDIGIVPVAEDLFVCNMIVQRGTDTGRHIPVLWFEHALMAMNAAMDAWPTERRPTLHCPRIGSGLGQTPWPIMEKAILSVIQWPVWVYDLPGSPYIGLDHRFAREYQV